MESDIFLTARRSRMREALVKQLRQSEDLNRQGFNFAASPYFQKYTNTLSMQGSAY